MQDAWRAYLELALGLTEASRKKAQKVAKKLVGKGGMTAAQLQALAEDLVSTSLANREALAKLVRFEVDRTLGRVGLATADEVADLTARVRDLEEELRQARAASTPESAPAATAPGAGPTAATDGATIPETTAPVAKKTIAKKTVAKKAVAKKAADAPPATATAPVKKAAAKNTAAKKTVAKKAVAKKAAGTTPAAGTAQAAGTADAADTASEPAKAPARKAPAKKAAKKTAPPAGEAS